MVSCDICGKTFSRVRNMSLHRERFHKFDVCFSCPVCSKTFLYQKNLLRHNREKHPAPRNVNLMGYYRDTDDNGTIDKETEKKGGNKEKIDVNEDSDEVKEDEDMEKEEEETDEMEEEELEADETEDKEMEVKDMDEPKRDEENTLLPSSTISKNYDILNLNDHPEFDESIESIEYHSHYPYTNSKLDPGEEIRIPIQLQDIYTLPSESFIYLEVSFLKEDGSSAPIKHKLINNPFGFLFDEIRYEICGTEIDKVRNPGIVSTLKGLASFSPISYTVTNMGWVIPFDFVQEQDKVSRFNVCIPLSMLLGFAEDYRKILINVKQELILVRARNDSNCFTQHEANDTSERVKIKLLSLCWKMPYVSVNELQKLTLINYLKTEKTISLHYRAWDMHEYPLLPTSNRQVWSIKTSTQLEKPRYVILAFQTGRNNDTTKPSSGFDHCDLTNVKLYLNSRVFPYDDLNLKFSQNKFALLYHMYASFQTSYYNTYQSLPYVSFTDFKEKCPMVVIDCSKQSESIKTGPVDVRLEFESEKNFPANTTAYCLLLHDRLVQYNPLTSVVHKMT